jgi:hypothetical protein
MNSKMVKSKIVVLTERENTNVIDTDVVMDLIM